MDAGQAFPNNHVSFATTGLALFLNTREVRFTHVNAARNLLRSTSYRTIRRHKLALVLDAVRGGLALKRVLPSNSDSGGKDRLIRQCFLRNRLPFVHGSRNITRPPPSNGLAFIESLPDARALPGLKRSTKLCVLGGSTVCEKLSTPGAIKFVSRRGAAAAFGARSTLRG